MVSPHSAIRPVTRSGGHRGGSAAMVTTVRHRHWAASSSILADGLERSTHLLRKDHRLLPRREVPTLVELVVIHELGIGPLRPTARGLVKLVGERAHGNRDADAF